MQRIFSGRIRAGLGWWALAALILGIGLLPWWRNRAYVRSFFDYGVVIGGVGRIHDGQRPYVDFITPIQSSWYVLNGLAEKSAGGTFQAMTWSGAASIVVSTLLLMGILSRRWPLLPSAAVAGSLVCATVVQHTIIWYNPWGVVLMTAVAWAGALAPVLRRTDMGWHALVALALFFGGINKINMQLLTLVIGWGWGLRAGFTGRSGWGRVSATLLFYLGFGLAVPVGAEMAWTGASFGTWWHNVVALPAASRSGSVLIAVSWDFFLKPLHDYYGTLLLPQVGLVGLLLSALVVTMIVRKTWNASGGERERFLPLACGLLAVAAGAVLETTNIDIAYIGLAGWFGLLISLWLGYDLAPRGPWFQGLLVWPALLIGVVSWHSAWLGQRSQFGHSSAARADYVPGERAGAAFAYFRGTRLPPELCGSLKAIGAWRQALDEESRNSIFYGPGAEWAAHIWPAQRTPGLPIYIHVGNSLGEREYERLYTTIWNGAFREILVSLVLDRWDAKLGAVLEDKYERTGFDDGMFYRYTRNPGASISAAPAQFIRRFGGNVDSRYLSSLARYFELEDKRSFLGTKENRMELRLNIPANRIRGEVIVQRTGADLSHALSADFAIYAQRNPLNRYERWKARVELPPGKNEIIVPYAIDGSHLPTTFMMETTGASEGALVAGWLNPYITDVGGDSASPVWFSRLKAPIVDLDEGVLARFLPGNWRPVRAQMRNGRVTEAGIELSPGGEIWLQVQGLVQKLSGIATFASGSEAIRPPVVRGVWYKAGRMQTYAAPSPETKTVQSFQTWCGEPGGWLVIAVDDTPSGRPVLITVNEVKQDH